MTATTRPQISRSLARVNPTGGTAMYDAVAEAVPMAQGGRNRKKAVVLISDGNDTNSRLNVGEVRQLVRETEVLVYAVGIDGQAEPTFGGGRPAPPIMRPPTSPIPFPLPGGRGRPGSLPFPIPPQPRTGAEQGRTTRSIGSSARVRSKRFEHPSSQTLLTDAFRR